MSEAISQAQGTTPGAQGLPTDAKTAIPGQEVNGQAATRGQVDQSGNAIKEAAAEARRKLKIDDQEVDEEEVLKVYRDRKGHQSAANKILQEGKAAKKQAEEFVSMMKDKQKLFDAIQKLGHDPRKLAEEYLAAQLEDELLDPREKDLRDTKAKLKAYEEMERSQKEAAEAKRDAALKAKFAEDYSKQFVDALKTEKLPPTKHAVAEMAKYIHRAAKMNFEMTAQEAAKLVKEDIESAHRNLYGEADAETLVKLLGEQGVNKLRAYDTSKIRSPEANLKTPQDQGDQRVRPRDTSKRMTPQQWREFNRK